ncbi:MAG TPA: transketolase [Chloroflexota bacterium]|nr:transketolase [Chloroflexota bacterium]
MTTETETRPTVDEQLQERMINTIRTLSIDMVQKANSGHPGAPLDAAPMAYTIFMRFLRFNPANPDWPNRDRFILSAGHASALLYSMLYLTGYDLSLEDLKQFRQWGSKTPGHPEYRLTPGVETSTGPLGQGFGNGVGMAIAEAYLASYFNRPGYSVMDHYIYCLCSDGDLQEGVTAEDASLAGHLKLGKLIYLYDSNKVQLSGPSTKTFTEDVLARFRAYDWHTQRVEDGNDVEAIARAIEEAQSAKDKPSIIEVRTVIGYASPEANTFKVHGEALGEEGVRATKIALGMPPDTTFDVAEDVLAAFRGSVPRGKQLENDWNDLFRRYRGEYPQLGKDWDQAKSWKLTDGWEKNLPSWEPDPSGVATREAGGKAMNIIAENAFNFMGGDADLAPSTKNNLIGFGDFEPGNYGGRNIHFGVREHAMGSITNGITLNGFIRTFGATFFNFSDYQRPAVRLAAIMEIPNIFLYTHDSVLLGEDGPTHQPVSQLMSLRAMPNIVVVRPADANEAVDAWKWIMTHWELPVALVLTRQKVPVLDRSRATGDLSKGAYILEDAPSGSPDIILMGSGSEVALCVGARAELEKQGIEARVISFPSWELFEQQAPEYRESVLPAGVTARVSVEAGATLGWCRWIGNNGVAVGVDRFGASAPAKEIAQHLGLTVDNVVRQCLKVLGK